jgi:hypothetical protein
VLLVKRLGYEGWKELKDYGKRWLVEIALSSFKRMLGETPRSRKSLSQRLRRPSRSCSTTGACPYGHRLKEKVSRSSYGRVKLQTGAEKPFKTYSLPSF